MQDLDHLENSKNTDFDPQNLVSQQAMPVAQAAQNDYVRQIADKIKSAENILVVLSKSPSIDEVSAAIALTLYLDGIQRHTTAVYSGKIPKELEFLEPKAAFETNTESLQDFIIALDKNKADHLRYKLEENEVRIYITPYRTTIDKKDLSFRRGDYNVDFVVAIGVNSAADLDAAITNHNEIMRTASAVDITCEGPGKFGEIEWSNQAASSVCEMMTELIFALAGANPRLDRDVATALLTGIVAATERFSNGRTNAETLILAAKLMEMGADQQLISANVVKNAVIENPAAQVAKKMEMPENLPEPAKMETAHAGSGAAKNGALPPAVAGEVASAAGAMVGNAAASDVAGERAAGDAAASDAAGERAAQAKPDMAEAPLPPATMTAKEEHAMNSDSAKVAAAMPLDLSGAVVQPIVAGAPQAAKPEMPKIETRPAMPEVAQPGAAAGGAATVASTITSGMPVMAPAAPAVQTAAAPAAPTVTSETLAAPAMTAPAAAPVPPAAPMAAPVFDPMTAMAPNPALQETGFTQAGKDITPPKESTTVDYGALIDVAIAGEPVEKPTTILPPPPTPTAGGEGLLPPDGPIA